MKAIATHIRTNILDIASKADSKPRESKETETAKSRKSA